MSLEDTLERTADEIARHGTHSELTVLEELAIAAGRMCPGAAAALVDWNGPEVTRLRAFGVVHGALVREIASRQVRDVAWLPAAPSTGRAA